MDRRDSDSLRRTGLTVASGDTLASGGELRFAFGRNWQKFLREVDAARLAEAEGGVARLLGTRRLEGKTFLDVGSGSGLVSLAAYRMGATVTSFDVDPDSVDCTKWLRERDGADVCRWDVRQGSVLDAEFLRGLGTFDIVYSWGVLHHTGDLWGAMDGIRRCVAGDGVLAVAIYNDQGRASSRWRAVKRAYNRYRYLRWPILAAAAMRLWVPQSVRDLVSGKPLATWRAYSQKRGMSPWRDVVDWVGGYPFEVATPEDVFDFLDARGFRLLRLKTCGGGLGCNEFVFRREHASGSAAAGDSR